MFLSRNKNIKHLVLATCTKLCDSAIICVAESLQKQLVCILLRQNNSVHINIS